MYLGCETAENHYHPNAQRQRGRIRTVFTDNQTEQLERLFAVTDYPTAETRAELAKNTGLSEETVRVRQCTFIKLFIIFYPSSFHVKLKMTKMFWFCTY